MNVFGCKMVLGHEGYQGNGDEVKRGNVYNGGLWTVSPKGTNKQETGGGVGV